MQKSGLSCCLVGNSLGKQMLMKHYEQIDKNLLANRDEYALKKYHTKYDSTEVSVKIHQIKGTEDRNMVGTK